MPLTQAPNNINIVSFLPNGYHLRPGKIYRFRLAVGNPWNSVDIFFKVSCCERKIVIEEHIELELEKRQIDKNNEEMPKTIEKVYISPNPTKENLTIKIDKVNKLLSYSIFDNSGLMVKKGEFTSKLNEETINISDLRKGIYLISVETEKTSFTEKIIKE